MVINIMMDALYRNIRQLSINIPVNSEQTQVRIESLKHEKFTHFDVTQLKHFFYYHPDSAKILLVTCKTLSFRTNVRNLY
jgi:hypothetical protein